MTEYAQEKITELEALANKARRLCIKELTEAGSGHTAGPLGLAEIFTAFYFNILNHNPKEPDWAERDRLFVSNGHVCPMQYAVMAMAGYFPEEELKTLRKFGSRLQGHPEKGRLPGVESTSGPLGLGLGQAAGYALGAKMDASAGSAQADFKVYCLMSDGEQDEGNTWESAMFAAKYKLDNLIAVIDRNGIQLSGPTEKIMPLEPLAMKYQAFGWQVFECDGNNIEEFINIIEEVKKITNKPSVIIADTVPGKGIKEIENDYHWHGKVPSKEEEQVFLKEII